MTQATTAASTDKSRWLKLILVLQSWPHPARVLLIVGTLIVVGWLDYVTGWEVSLFVFYIIPVVLAAWILDRNAAVMLAIAHGPIWWFANEASRPYETFLGYNWAMVSRIIVFVFIAVGASAIRSKQEADAARIQMLEEVRRLQTEIVAASEHEQQRIGQDLHDGLCQQLAAIGCAARALADDLQARNIDESRDAEKIETAIQQAVTEARSLARGIFPVHVDRTGLSTALTELAQSTERLTGIPISVVDSVDVQVEDPETAMHLYRIAQEAVANAVRHSGANEVRICLRANEKSLELSVEDNGQGINGNSKSSGMGLRTMRYRAHALGAKLNIQSQSGVGTCVSCRLKVRTC